MPLFKPNVDRLQVRRDVKGLIKASTCRRDPIVRRKSALALAWIAGPEALEPLVALLQDKDPQVRESIPGFLAEFAQRHPDKELRLRIVQALVDRYEAGDEAVRKPVAQALPQVAGLLGDRTWCRKAAEVMLAELEDPESPAEFEAKLGLTELAHWLKGSGLEPKAVRILETLIGPDSNWGLRRVSQTMADLGAPPVDALLHLLDQERHQDRQNAALALKELFESGRLTGAQKTHVLEHQPSISRPHQDIGYTGHTDNRTEEYHIDLEPHHADHTPMSDCANHGDRQVDHQDGIAGGHTDEQLRHTDEGIGVELQV